MASIKSADLFSKNKRDEIVSKKIKNQIVVGLTSFHSSRASVKEPNSPFASDPLEFCEPMLISPKSNKHNDTDRFNFTKSELTS